jgi:hypothetical protein
MTGIAASACSIEFEKQTPVFPERYDTTASEASARSAAHEDGWFEWFGYWFFIDPTRMMEYQRPACFYGTARDLCLMHGIQFDGT